MCANIRLSNQFNQEMPTTMRFNQSLTGLLLLLGLAIAISACRHHSHSHQIAQSNFVAIAQGESLTEIIPKAANVTPSQKQYDWQKLEFIAFIHFGINTFLDHEWGEGNEDISQFNPTALDVNQWVQVCQQAGMKLIILTAKHHDGFCLWPSKFTEHTIKHTPYRNGQGDLVGELSAACRQAGMKFGVYLSPWDRHERTYGDSPAYNQFFRNQLTELLTNYGEITEVWFDGACGEGPNGKRQVYDWPSYYRLIRKLQPKAVIAIMGPDVRWVGTESGYARETEWSVLPLNLDADQMALISQPTGIDGVFIPRDLMDEDLGSREKIKNASALIWYPAEADVSIRPGWFYHRRDDDQVKSPAKLVDIYYSSVGRNAVLLLNIPPDTRGLIHENDIKTLLGMRQILVETFKTNLAEAARIFASNEKQGHEAAVIVDDDETTYWTTEDGVDSATIELQLLKPQTFDQALLQEQILVGQRIEKFHLEVWDGKSWQRIAEGATVGYKRLLRFSTVTTDRVRLVIEQSRTSPTLAQFGLFKAPPETVDQVR